MRQKQTKPPSTFQHYSELWTYETERMLLDEIIRYIEQTKDKHALSARDFLEKTLWVINGDEWTKGHLDYINTKIQEYRKTGRVTTEYDPEIQKTKISKHGFKAHEWLYIKTRQELVELLKDYKTEFGIKDWLVNDIEYFLQLKHYLYPRAHWQEHHVRAIATIINQEGVL